MREIPLSAGRGVVLVSIEDYDAVASFRWHLHSAGYAYRAEKRRGKQTNFLMHREIARPGAGLVVDHINGNRLDNRRENLRVCTYAQNARNNGPIEGTSKLRGVSWHTKAGKWRATIKLDGKAKHVGYFDTQEAAAAAYDQAARNLHGEFARTNGGAAMTHSDLVNAILLEVSPLGLAWSNQTGQGWTGQFIRTTDEGLTILKNARPVRFGLPGSTDVLACVRRRMVVIEAKTGTGRLQQNQRDFSVAAVKAGAIHILARSVEDVTDTLRLEGLL